MKETERIIELFADLYDGQPWIAVNITDNLKNLSAEKAARKLTPRHNSIWEIVNHLVAWRDNALQRVQGVAMKTPADNYFKPVADTSEAAWQETLQALKTSQEQWVAFLRNFDETDFEKKYKPNSLSYYKHIHGIIQHDAYHLGQIVLLAKD